MGKFYKSKLSIFVNICFILFASSCISPKSVTYFNNLPVAEKVALDSLKVPQPIIVTNDILEIKIGGENEKTVQYINQYLGAGSVPGVAQQYTVDVDGNIELPKFGKIKMAGLTREQARDTLTAVYSQYLQNPIVTVKFSNFRFSVLGEVKSPGTFTSSSEKINVFEALAQAGDITQFGRLKNVRIIRDFNGKRSIIMVDLTDKKILNSEYFYINRYDMIFVESRNLKSVTDNLSRTATFIGTIASIAAIVLVLLKK